MDAFMLIDLIDEAPDLGVGVGEVEIVGEINLLFFDSTDHALGKRVVFRLAGGRQADCTSCSTNNAT